MAGIYIHVPFCKTRCLYCDFYSQIDESPKRNYTAAVCEEIRIRKHEIDERIDTIYFGGGTPSCLSVNNFVGIFEQIFLYFNVAPNAEITLEANPDDLSRKYIQELRTLPFNRISIGIQSFDEKALKFLNRRHSAQQAVHVVKECRQQGLENISIDLMYGLPNQTLEEWQETLSIAMSLDIQHISAYHLIYEENTMLYKLLSARKIQPVTEETSNQMFEVLIETLTKNGFEHYEISNFAKNDFHSQHNTSYWQNEPYLGLGPSAHSFDGTRRSWNVSDLSDYLHGISQNKRLYESEILSETDKYNEFILTGLRTSNGVNLSEIEYKFGKDKYNYCIQNAQKYIDCDWLQLNDNTLKLTRAGILVSDGVMSELMWV